MAAVLLAGPLPMANAATSLALVDETVRQVAAVPSDLRAELDAVPVVGTVTTAPVVADTLDLVTAAPPAVVDVVDVVAPAPAAPARPAGAPSTGSAPSAVVPNPSTSAAARPAVEPIVRPAPQELHVPPVMERRGTAERAAADVAAWPPPHMAPVGTEALQVELPTIAARVAAPAQVDRERTSDPQSAPGGSSGVAGVGVSAAAASALLEGGAIAALAVLLVLAMSLVIRARSRDVLRWIPCPG